MKPMMRFHVFDAAFGPLGQFNSYTYAEWRGDYRETGKLYIECRDTEYNTAILQPGNYLYRPDIGKAMVIRQVEYEQFSHLVKVRGFTSLDLLAQRVINPSDTVHTMEVLNVEQGIYDVVNTNARGLDGIVTAPVKGYTETHDTQFTGTKVLDATISLAEEADFGLDMDFDYRGKRHLLEVYKGADRTYGNGTLPHVVFSDNPRNVNNLVIVNDNGEFCNFAYVAGEGEGTDRVVVPVPNTTDDPGAVVPTGTNRFEMWLDARNVQRNGMTLAKYRQKLYAKGIETLNQKLSVLSFSADPVTDGSYEFRKDYDLGDLVTCESKLYGIRFNARVESYSEITQNNGTILKIQLGKPVLARQREVM